MHKKKIIPAGLTLIELMIVVAILGLLTALVVPALIRTRMVSNESIAKATLRTISNALEMYLSANSSYPSAESQLLSPAVNPPFLGRAYDGQTIRGYTYDYDLSSGYAVTATPDECNTTGSKVFTISNATISEAACSEP